MLGFVSNILQNVLHRWSSDMCTETLQSTDAASVHGLHGLPPVVLVFGRAIQRDTNHFSALGIPFDFLQNIQEPLEICNVSTNPNEVDFFESAKPGWMMDTMLQAFSP